MAYTPPKYPGEIPDLTDLPNYVDDQSWVKAHVLNDIKKEVRAALLELGVNPKGAYADVSARLDTLSPVLLGSFGASTPNGVLKAPTGSITCSTYYACRYAKIGPLIHYSGELRVSAIDNPSGEAHIPVPFRAHPAPLTAHSTGVLRTHNITYPGDTLVLYLNQSEYNMFLQNAASGAPYSYLDASNISVGSRVTFSLTCITDQ